MDGVGGETECWATGLLKPWSGAKYVTLVTPLLHSTDTMGMLQGALHAGLALQQTAVQVIIKWKAKTGGLSVNVADKRGLLFLAYFAISGLKAV